MKPISRDDLLARARAHAQRDALQLPRDRNGKLDDKAARKALSGDLRATYLALTKTGAKPDVDALVGAYEGRLAAQLEGLTGTGRSAKLVSAAEAEALPEALAKAYTELRDARRAQDLRARAKEEPFPKGAVDRALVFDTFLVARGGETASKIFDALKVEARLDALETSVAKKPLAKGDVTAVKPKALPYGASVGGAKLSAYGDAPKLALTDGRSIVTVAKNDDLVRGEELVLTRFDAKGGEPLAATVYRTGRGGLAALMGRMPAAAREGLARVAEGPGFASVDREGLALVARALGAVGGATAASVRGAEAELARYEALENDTLAAFAHRDRWVSKYRALADQVRREGTLKLGDADTFVSLTDRFTRTDSDDREHTLVAGRGPLLVVDNHFGGLGHAVALEPLARGELEVHVFHEQQPLGVLRVDAEGRALEVPGKNPMHRVANDLDEFLPAQLDR
ncbi:hypothetical protein L6R52_12775 [Myxococcota bacterium]|nr:hypothetical protein [Myxococcota bacterium]